jgi:hypothetical protein
MTKHKALQNMPTCSETCLVHTLLIQYSTHLNLIQCEHHTTARYFICDHHQWISGWSLPPACITAEQFTLNDCWTSAG